jgi:hypothetical protein
MIMKNSLFLIVLCFTVCSANAQLKASVKDLAFMSGTWVQKSSWGDLEEYWSAPQGESMVSCFRCLQDDKAVFYEFMVIEQEADIPVMKMRHFNRGSIAWEPKDAPILFPLTSITSNKATFYSKEKDVKLTYQLQSSNSLEVILEEKDNKGRLKKDVFNFSRKK